MLRCLPREAQGQLNTVFDCHTPITSPFECIRSVTLGVLPPISNQRVFLQSHCGPTLGILPYDCHMSIGTAGGSLRAWVSSDRPSP